MNASAADIDNRALIQAVKDGDLERFKELLNLSTVSADYRDGVRFYSSRYRVVDTKQKL